MVEPRKKIKTQSVKQKCFESITQSILRLRKPKIKSYLIQKRKTDKPNVIITIVYPMLPLLCVSCWEPHCHIAQHPCNSPTRCAFLWSLNHRGKITYPSHMASKQRLHLNRPICNAKPVSLEHMASNPGRWEAGQSKTAGGTEAPKTRWPAYIPLAKCSQCLRDDKDTCWQCSPRAM